jgi:4-amino-4-deoxy-L-arabinose transferase-like glycosyltransferase
VTLRIGNRVHFDWCTPKRALIGICVIFVALSSLVALGTPPWETNDEPSHAQNVETLRAGHWYRITPNSGVEPGQPPLYYLALAAYAEVLGLSQNRTDPEPVPGLDLASVGFHFRHDTPHERADRQYVRALRLPSIFLGLITVLLAFALAQLVSKDAWTPVVAAATCAFIPRLIFVSGAINNDNLAITLGALAAYAAVRVVVRPVSPRGQIAASLALGAMFGALMITKLSAIPIGIGMTVAVVLMTRSGEGSRARRVAIATTCYFVAAAVVCGWWLVRNSAWYGDPFGARASVDHLKRVLPQVVKDAGFSLRRTFIDLPKGLWKSFWYTSGSDQFQWSRWWYLPFWFALLAGFAGLAFPRGRRFFADPTRRRAAIVLLVMTVSAFVGYWIVGLQTAGVTQGRYVLVGATAIATLFALGVERLRLPVIARFVLPAMGIVGTCVAIVDDVFAVKR